jgi:small subunit ribosomal protein S21e
MENAEGKKVDLYIPRKCSATKTLITPKDHAAIQINVGHVDEKGVYTGEVTAYTISGKVRVTGKADAALNCLATDGGFLKNVVKGPTAA